MSLHGSRIPAEYVDDVVINGGIVHRFSDGTLLPRIAGGAEDGADPADKDGGDDPADKPPADLGDAGKKALTEERKAKADAERKAKAAEKRATELEKKLQEREDADKSDSEKALEKARKEAAEEATKAATAKTNHRILAAEIKAAAGGKLSDPADAVRLLDLDDFTVSDDGEVDDKAITAAIDQLLKDKPYLAGKASGKPTGSADGGGKPSGDSTDVTPGTGRLRHAYANRAKT